MTDGHTPVQKSVCPRPFPRATVRGATPTNRIAWLSAPIARQALPGTGREANPAIRRTFGKVRRWHKIDAQPGEILPIWWDGIPRRQWTLQARGAAAHSTPNDSGQPPARVTQCPAQEFTMLAHVEQFGLQLLEQL